MRKEDANSAPEQKGFRVEPELVKTLHGKFISFWKEIGAKSDGMEVWNDVQVKYTEHHRGYHNLWHINTMLNELEDVKDLVENPNIITAAIWFHDIFYDKNGNNEERSANYAAQTLKRAGIDDEFTTEVKDLILATKHTSPPESLNEQVLVDLDFAILGMPEEIFGQYEEGVTFEYLDHFGYSPKAFYNGRAGVLRGFKDREHLYSTRYFRDKYEKQAKMNLERSIAVLEEKAK